MTPQAGIVVPRRGTLPSLTGLRFIAALAVFGTHSVFRIADGHVKNVLVKLGAHSQLEAVVIAMKHQMIRVGATEST